MTVITDKKKIVKSCSTVLNVVTLVLAAAVLLAFIFAARLVPSENEYADGVTEFTAGWKDIHGNSAAVPSDIESDNGTIVISNTLPLIEKNSSVCIRSSQQDAEIYIGNELRKRYSSESYRLFGKNSASRYVIAELSPEDSGKEITIRLKTTSSMYAGRINMILLGNETAIILGEFSKYIVTDIGALLLIVMGIIGVIFAVIYSLVNKKKTPVTELSAVAILTGIWRLCESRMRQFYFESNSAYAAMAFVALALLPVFVLRFVDSVFEKRYRRLFLCLSTISIGIFAAESVLQLLNIRDFVELLSITMVEAGALLLVIITLLILEFKKGYTKNYSLKAIGIIVIALCAAAEISLSGTILKDRILIAIGVMLLFFLTIIEEIRNIVKNSISTHVQLQEHAEALTLQVVTALSATVEAKDKYTNGHSERVAEYAREIAARYGMSEEKLVEIYYAGLLHDIGKIAVPDSIINKTGALTEEEYSQVKLHPAAGADILKKVTEMPKLQIGARWHHERYDGKGYPDGLAGEAIPVEARIIAVADSYDAMTSFRSYRAVRPQREVAEEIRRCSGTQFDPVFADIMLGMIAEDKEYSMRETARTEK